MKSVLNSIEIHVSGVVCRYLKHALSESHTNSATNINFIELAMLRQVNTYHNYIYKNPHYDDIRNLLGLSGYACVSDEPSFVLEWTPGFHLVCTNIPRSCVYKQAELRLWVLTRPYMNKYRLVSSPLLGVLAHC
jgi:hypothetical protein